MANNATPDAKYGLKLATAVDGCIANTLQLVAWGKAGTLNGGRRHADDQVAERGRHADRGH